MPRNRTEPVTKTLDKIQLNCPDGFHSTENTKAAVCRAQHSLNAQNKAKTIHKWNVQMLNQLYFLFQQKCNTISTILQFQSTRLSAAKGALQATKVSPNEVHAVSNSITDFSHTEDGNYISIRAPKAKRSL